jgi:Ca-activated chloride channel family protein
MITPLTDDFRTIKNLLPELDTSLVTIQGDRLKPALQMAASMLKDEAGDDKSILVIGDGDFQETDIADLVQAAGGATIYTMGVGLPNSGLRADRLRMLANAGHGIYVEANYTDSSTRAILSRMGVATFRARASGKNVRTWEERFYIPALLLAFLLLPLFRKGATFPVILLLSVVFVPLDNAKANTVTDWFMNRDQQAKATYDNGDYKGAMTKFDTPYQRGVAAYRAKQYDKAALLFQAAAREKARLSAFYNLGNAQLMQDQVENAIVSYKAALRQKPDDVATQHNLAIALKMLAQEQQQGKSRNQQNKGGNGGGQNSQSGEQQAGQQHKDGSQSTRRGSPQPARPGSDQKTAQQQQGQSKQGSPGKAQPDTKQSTASRMAQGEKQMPQQNSQYGMAVTAPRRTQRDVNADQWLIRLQSDPGSFLKNQFAIEDQKSGLQQTAPPR